MTRAFPFVALVAVAAATHPAWAEDRGERAPLLTVDQAIAAARESNHQLASTSRVVAQASEREAALKTRRLPSLSLDAFGGRLIDSVDFKIPAGSLGTIPGVGALPPTDKALTVPTDFFGVGQASVGQPLTQQYKIGLRLDAVRLERDVAIEDLRHDKQRVAADVRTAYYEISATQAAVRALQDLVRAIEEVDKITDRYVDEGLALRAEALEVKARLARERQRLEQTQSGLDTQREHLNQLMGRGLTTPFRVATPEELIAREAALSLAEARDRAAARRPEVHTASLRAAQADTARNLANAGWIPDVTLVASYTAIANVDVAPDHMATVGVLFSWEPFDWGRKSHEAKEHALQVEQAREGKLETEEQIAVEVGQRWRSVKDADALLGATHLSEEAAQAYLENTRNRYREDARMLQDVLEAEARLSRARHDFTDALAGYWSASAELERTIGNED
jgi:outer membrane protein TolC